MSDRARVLGVSFGMAVVSVVVAAGPVAARHDPAAREHGARVTSDMQLEDVSADSATDAWAVGYDASAEQPILLHWDGHGLSQMASPVPGELFGVSALTPTQAWAVGSYAPRRAHKVQTLVLQWDGARWSALPSPNPSSFFNTLEAVRALAPDDVWAAGYSLSARTHRRHALVLRWNGTKWSTIRVPSNVARDVLQNGFTQVAPISSTNALAVVRHRIRVGHGTVTSDKILRWNGDTWSPAGGPFIGAALSGVVSLSADATWVVGDYCRVNRCPPFDTLTLRPNGKRWDKVPSPHLQSSHLASVSASSASDAWAVGSYCRRTCSHPHTLILRWDGSSWSRVQSPPPAITLSSALSPVSATDAWAVGTDGTGTVLLHWNGAAWAEM
jgi:hypothetical protein